LKNSLKWIVVFLLLLSGFCALIYQVGWLRELRLVFGGSTLAMAVVLAIFMGGLGFGGLFWGRIADRFHNPFRLYAYFEIGIALFAAVSPFLLSMVRHAYLGLGGSMAMGPGLALLVRIIGSAAVLGIPTFLMGGTLPAVARTIETETDRGRRDLALLYASNTIGGVCGVIIATFILLELAGTRLTIWYGSLLNLIVGCLALFLSARYGPVLDKDVQRAPVHEDSAPAHIPGSEGLLPSYAVYGTAFLAGFCFFIMEIIWNRMLIPLLGGSVYSFGLVIGVVLAGIGLGGWLYSIGDKRFTSSVNMLVVTLALEALALAVPFALGDKLALLAALLWPFGSLGFGELVSGWIVVTSCLVLPASVVAGYQFPLLVNLLGQGRQDIGNHIGKVYAWNTFGAITGLLLGGLGLMRLLSAPGCWLAVVLILCLLGAVIGAWLLLRQDRKLLPALATVCICGALLIMSAEGPTAAWRHSPIAVGLVDLTGKNNATIREWINQKKRHIIWEVDGIESSIGLSADDGLAFIINGKVDGNASRDAGTQVMGPLIGAILHPGPRKALVIGLGTGSSGGWLAAIDTMEQVDVMELEPAMLEVARRSAPVNRNVLDSSKVNVIIGDARESLMTSGEKYDVIFSEPSNPYRAGIASLYTQEFYQAVHRNLQPGGFFSQWVQAYGIDSETLNTITATLATVFQEVEIWQSKSRDFVFVCSKKKNNISIPELRDRLAAEPFRSALVAGWGMNDLEGFLGAKIADSSFARKMKDRQMEKGLINVDDRMLVEFGFARGAGKKLNTSPAVFRQSLMDVKEPIPLWGKGIAGVDWKRVSRSYAVMFPSSIDEMIAAGDRSPTLGYWQIVYQSFLRKDYDTILDVWRSGYWLPEYPLEKAVVAEALAESGDDRAMKWSDSLSEIFPVEAKVILGRYFWRKDDAERAYQVLEAALLEYRENPWPQEQIMRHGLDLVGEISMVDKKIGLRFFDLLQVPFSVYNLNDYRFYTLLTISSNQDCEQAIEVFGLMEPNVPYKREVLEYRQRCYAEAGNPLMKQAQKELQEFQEEVDLSFTANFL
jgi:spermidine synthase